MQSLVVYLHFAEKYNKIEATGEAIIEESTTTQVTIGTTV